MTIQKEYIVTLHKFEDLESFYYDMENPGGSPYVPSRAVPVHARRKVSLNTHYYLTKDEADTLKNDPRVAHVTLSFTELNLTNEPCYVQSSSFWSRSPSFASNLEKNWGLLRSTQGTQPAGWGNSFQTLAGTINIPFGGQHVDVVIVDGLFDPTHPEFTTSPDGTGPSRVYQYNWFELNPELGKGAPTVYNYNVSTPTNAGHGMFVAGVAVGNTQGWAKNANIYNIGPYGENGLQPEEVLDYIKVWHNNKLVNPITGRKNPTIINLSYATITSVSIPFITTVVREGVTSAGPFTIFELNALGIHTEGTNARIITQRLDVESDISQCINDGILVVGAAGNFGQKITRTLSDPSYDNRITISFNPDPVYTNRGSYGAAPNVICVGNVDSVDPERKYIESQCGPRIDVYAPGTNVTSAYNAGIPDPRNSLYYIVKASGTSGAAPQVTGLLACLLEPLYDLTQAQAIEYIKKYSKSNQLVDQPTGGVMFSYNLQGSPNRYLYAELGVVLSTTVTYPTNNLIRNNPIVEFSPISVTAGLNPYTFAISPSLPAGLSLNTSTGLISGTPTVNVSSSTFTITTTDNIGRAKSNNFNITVVDLLTTTLNNPSNSFYTSVPISPFTPVTASGGHSSKIYSISPTLPIGLTFNTTTGLISGTPLEIVVNKEFTVTVTDFVGQTSSKVFTITTVIQPVQTTFEFTEGVYASSPIIAATTNTTFKVISGKLPSNLSLTTNGYIVGIPEYVSNTTTNRVIVRVTNQLGDIKDFTVRIAVVGKDKPLWNTITVVPSGPSSITTSTSSGYLMVGLNNKAYVMNNQYIDYNLSALPQESPSTTELTYYIPNNGGSLPSNLTLEPNGRLHGVLQYFLDAIPTTASNYTSTVFIPKTYQFKVVATDGIESDERLFKILAVDPNMFRPETPVLPSEIDTTASIILANSGPLSYLQPVQFINDSDLGTIRAENNKIISVAGYNPTPLVGTVTYSIITGTGMTNNLPQYLSVDSISGYISGFVPYQPAYTRSYQFTVQAVKNDLETGQSVATTNTFTLAVKGMVDSTIQWVSTGSLGTITTGEISELAIVAKQINSDYSIKYTKTSGSLPPGLELLSDGSISGRVSYGTTGTYVFSAQAGDVYELSSIEKEFSITVENDDTEYTDMYLRPLLSKDQKEYYRSFINDNFIFDPNFIYRKFDTNFGIQSELKITLEFGIEKLSARKYAENIQQNFYRRRFYFGDIKIAYAKDALGNNLYELIYADVVDDLINNKGISISDIIDWNSIQYYPASIDNMRSKLEKIILNDSTTIRVNRNYLPKFMTTSQPGELDQPGYIRVIPICYALPGYGKKIISRIKLSKFDIKQINFEIDRITIRNTADANREQYLFFNNKNIKE